MNWLAVLCGFLLGPATVLTIAPLVWLMGKLRIDRELPSVMVGGILFIFVLSVAVALALRQIPKG